MTDLSPLLPLAARIVAEATAKKMTIATAESCTGGLIAALLTEIAGSSAVVDRGFVTYSNAAKTEMLGVPAELIGRAGAVSPEVAVAMADGALRVARTGLAIAVTGIAGPTGGSPAKPVGLVHFALAERGAPTRHAERRFGDIGRQAIRTESVETALNLLYRRLA